MYLRSKTLEIKYPTVSEFIKRLNYFEEGCCTTCPLRYMFSNTMWRLNRGAGGFYWPCIVFHPNPEGIMQEASRLFYERMEQQEKNSCTVCVETYSQ